MNIAAIIALARRFWPVAAVIFGLLAIWYYGHTRYQAGVAHMQTEIDRANAAFLAQKARADELATIQRLADTIAVNRQEGDLRNAIAQTPDSAPDAVRIRLGCERLRASGQSTAGIPACR